MQFTCERQVLADALGAASRAATGRASNPTLSCVRMVLAGNSLRITGTDGDLTIDVAIEVAGSKDGVVLVPAKLASDVVRSLTPGRVSFTAGSEKVEISADKVKFTVPLGVEGDFPKWTGTVGEGAPMPSKDLAEALRQVVRAASTDEARGVYTGVLLTGVDGKLRLVATDSYRMAIRDIDASVVADGVQVVIPARALGELQKLLGSAENVSISLTDNDATFEVGPIRLVTRLLVGAFADYQRLIPASLPNTLTVNKDAILEAIRRVKLVARDPIGTPLRLEITGDGITLRMVTPDSGEAVEQIEGVVSGNDIEIRFNNELLSSGLDAAASDDVVIQTSEPGKLAVIRGEGSEAFTYLLMPLKS